MYCVKGKIISSDNPLGKVVRAYDRSTGAFLGTDNADSKGYFNIRFLSSNNPVNVIALDDSGISNDLIHHNEPVIDPDYYPVNDINTAVYQKSFSIINQETIPMGLNFKPDGTMCWITGGNKNIHQYNLTTPWDIGTASYIKSVYIGDRVYSPLAFSFSPDGTNIYFQQSNTDKALQYTLSTPWDIATMTWVCDSLNMNAPDHPPSGNSISPDGTKYYTCATTWDYFYQFSFDTPFDLSTLRYDYVRFSIVNQDTWSRGICFKSDGTKLWMVGDDTNSIYQYSLSVPWDLNFISYDSKSLYIGSQDTVPTCLFINSLCTNLYLLGRNGGRIYQYSL